MKITDVKTYITEGRGNPWIFVHVETDAGIVGLGDATNYPGGLSVARAIHDVKEIVIGADPHNIEALWQAMYRQLYYVGVAGVAISAISGIELALWDILGQELGVPIYRLLGGVCHPRLPLYTHPNVRERTPSAYVDGCLEALAAGFQAVKFDPFLRDYKRGPFQNAHLNRSLEREEEDEAIAIVRAVRQAVGPAVRIALDAHGQFDMPTAIRLARRLEEFDLFFYEEPIPPENIDALVELKRSINIPLCVGERQFTRQGFRTLLEKQAAHIIMPDVVRTGGIAETRKIAAMAETYYVPVAPHNPNSPLSTFASSHVCASIPNFLILEIVHHSAPHAGELLSDLPNVVAGNLELPTAPGIGAKLNLKAAARYAYSE